MSNTGSEFGGFLIGIVVTAIVNLILIDDSTEMLTRDDASIISEIEGECKDSEMQYFNISSHYYPFSKRYAVEVICEDGTIIKKSLKRS